MSDRPQVVTRAGRAPYLGQRWVVLGLGWAAQATTASYLYGIAALVPAFRRDDHLRLAHAELVVAAPSAGVLLALVAWGAAADHFGERVVIATGLGLAGVLLLASAFNEGLDLRIAFLVAAGAAGASVNAASGRVVMGWFHAAERGRAMGIRQTAQPVGVGLGALVFPELAARGGIGRSLGFSGALCLVVALLVAAFVADPSRPDRAHAPSVRSPYRDSTLWRLHGASALLVVPQFAVSAFAFEFLVSQRQWTDLAAGRVVFIGQLLGAAGRIGAGVWSDRVASRLRPMRQLAMLSAGVMALISLSDYLKSPAVIVAFVLGAVITVADNGLGFTATAELAGSAWAGRALGVQNTAQNLAAVLTPPLLGALIGAKGYAVGFALVILFPLLAYPLTPVTAEQRAHPV